MIALAALLAATPSPSPPEVVSPAPVDPPAANTGTMALWIGLMVLAVLSAAAYLVVRHRRAAAEAEQLDSET